MLKRSLRLIAPVFAALGVACEGYRGIEPERRVLTTIEVKPTDAWLSTIAPGNMVQLSFWAYDQSGVLMPMPRVGAVTYSSSAPAIARVSSSGVVTSVAPGTAAISAALTVLGVARTLSMTVTVHNGDYSGIAGVYDLTALVTSFDPGWEDLTGYRYTAALTLGGEGAQPVRGTFADLRLIGPGGDTTHIATTGLVTGSIDPRGRLIIELFSDGTHGNRFTLTLIVETRTSGLIDGTFDHDQIRGTFTATRNQAE